MSLKHLFHKALFLPILAVPFLGITSCGQPYTYIITDYGIVETCDQEITTFYGVPYAETPIGQLRLAAPQESPHWGLIKNCSRPSNKYSWQSGVSNIQEAKMTEDCLNLDIWKPQYARRAPVLVWIHGGSLTYGSSYESNYGSMIPTYDFSAFVRQGIVCVSINYRLGDLGFLGYEGNYDSENTVGNFGLLDCIQALKWVQNEISYFGGDANNVTIAGQSSGSNLVSALITSPMASGLFRRVIMESGNILGTLTFHSQGEKEAQKAIEKSFCNGIGISDNESADRLAKIRELDARSLQRDGNQEHDTGYEGYLSLLTFDGKTLNTRGNILNNINNVDLLFGYDINDFNNRLGHINTQEEYDAILGNLLGAEGATAWKAQFPKNDGNTYKDLAVKLGRNIEPYAGGCKILADHLLNQNNKVYGFECALGSGGHGSELPYVFNINNSQTAIQLNSYWSNFIYYGDPNVNSLPHWDPFNSNDNKILRFNQDGSFNNQQVVDIDAVNIIATYLIY